MLKKQREGDEAFLEIGLVALCSEMRSSLSPLSTYSTLYVYKRELHP